MKVVQFIADNAAAALAQIHDQLGPDAVVLSVRRLPAQGVSRLWQKSGRIEVLAGVPDGEASSDSETPDFGGGRLRSFSAHPVEGGDFTRTMDSRRWKTVAWLEMMGLMPDYAERLQNHLNSLHPAVPTSLDVEWREVQAGLKRFWTDPPLLERGTARPHVFIGPPGSGKTTALCKWLTLAVLTEERAARVWRLDSHIANTAEFLTVHCEMLDAPVERFWSPPKQRGDLYFIDLPGVEVSDSQALSALQGQLALLTEPHIHVVLNAAYETSVLLDQWRAYAVFEPEDLIFTHLDEETRRVKLWNFVFGTNCFIRFLCAGQKIPGEFKTATPELLLPSEFLRK